MRYGLTVVTVLTLISTAQAVEIRTDPYRLWQGLEGAADEGPVMFDVAINATGRWGYRWQFNPVFNVQLGLSASAGEITSRQGERCATDGEEVDLGAIQNVVDPRLDFKFSLRL